MGHCMFFIKIGYRPLLNLFVISMIIINLLNGVLRNFKAYSFRKIGSYFFLQPGVFSSDFFSRNDCFFLLFG